MDGNQFNNGYNNGYNNNFNNNQEFGQPYTYNSTPNVTYNDAPKKKSKAPIIIIVCILLLASCCACCLVFGKWTITLPSQEKETSEELLPTIELEEEQDDDGFSIGYEDEIGEDTHHKNDKEFVEEDKDYAIEEENSEEVTTPMEEQTNENENTNPEPITSSISTTYNHEYDLVNPSITIEGVTYTFPMTVQTLLDNGFVADEEDMKKIMKENNIYMSSLLVLYKNDNAVFVRIINTTDKPVEFKDAEVYAISVSYDKYSENNLSVQVPSGVELGKTTIEEFDSVFTNPTYSYDSEKVEIGSHTRTFGKDSETHFIEGNSYEYGFYENVLDEIKVIYLP